MSTSPSIQPPLIDLVDLDRQHLIHPVANFREHERKGVTLLESGRGAFP